MVCGESVGITIIGGIKISGISNTSVSAIGDNTLQALNSVAKNNNITGNINGDFNFNNSQPFNPINIDPDGLDTSSPTVQPAELG